MSLAYCLQSLVSMPPTVPLSSLQREGKEKMLGSVGERRGTVCGGKEATGKNHRMNQVNGTHTDTVEWLNCKRFLMVRYLKKFKLPPISQKLFPPLFLE